MTPQEGLSEHFGGIPTPHETKLANAPDLHCQEASKTKMGGRAKGNLFTKLSIPVLPILKLQKATYINLSEIIYYLSFA